MITTTPAGLTPKICAANFQKETFLPFPDSFSTLSQADQTELGNKIDANELLITRGDKFLNELVAKIIDDSRSDFGRE